MIPSAGEGCGPPLPWYDLEPELREAILVKVPLLRLAQLAVQCREFRAVYRKRLAAQERDAASLPYPLTRPLHRLFWWSLSFSFLYPGQLDFWRWNPNLADYTHHSGSTEGLPWEGLAITTDLYLHRLFSNVVRIRTEARYMAEGSEVPCSAKVVLRFSVKSRGWRRKLVGTELIVDCSDTCEGIRPTFGVVIGVELASAVRSFLDLYAGGEADGLPRKGEAGPIERVLIVMPKGSTWPDGDGVEEICDGVTTILAKAWGTPSAVLIRVTGERWRAREWRLPCVLPDLDC